MFVSSTSFSRAHGWSAPLPESLDDANRTIVFVFGAPDIHDDPVLRDALRTLRATFPSSAILGCSTAGEIHGTQIHDNSLSVAIVKFDTALVRFASAPVESGGSFEAGQTIARELSRNDLRSLIVLSDGLHINGSELVRGINTMLSPEIVVTGGLAGDGARFKNTWVLEHGVPQAQRVAAVGIYGSSVRVGHGSRGGWDIFGPERRVTRAKGNVLYEIDDKPALALYKKYLGDQAAGLPSTALLFPLALRSSNEDPKTLVRTVLAVDEATSSLTFAGDIPTGSLVRLMHANFDRLIDGASSAGLATTECGTPKGDSLTIAVSCVGRRLVLGERAEEEVEAAFGALSASTKLVGFYSYGEISPHSTGQCDLHNQTMTLTSVWEEVA